MPKSSQNHRAAFLALMLLTLIWGYNWVVMKIGIAYASALDFAAMRLVLGALSLFLALIALRKPLKPKALPGTILLGLMQNTATVGLITWALVNGGAGKTAVLNYTMPFWLLLFSWIFLKETLKRSQWLSVGMAVTGLLLVLMPLDLSSGLGSKIIAVGAGICWAISAVLARMLQRDQELDLLSMSAWQMLFGSIPLAIAAWIVPTQPIVWSPTFIGALLYNAVPAAAIAWLLWFYALNNLPVGTAGLSTLAAPVIGVLAAWLQLGERPSSVEGLGMVLILVALTINAVQTIQTERQGSKPTKLRA
ncbi:DMT family transporter [Thermoleptolyngbya sp.]